MQKTDHHNTKPHSCDKNSLHLPLNYTRPREDPYQVEGLPRDIVKKWVVAAFGMGKVPTRWSSKAGEDYLETSKSKKKLGKDYPMKLVTPKILLALPVLHSLKEREVSCFDLMYRESNAMVASMLRLLRVNFAPSFSVHDSLIVRKKDQSLAMKVLKEEYKKATGITPSLNIT